MKNLLPWAVLLILLLCGCSLMKRPTPVSPSPSETEDEPLNITSFSFTHSASNADACFRFQITREEEGVRLYAEELFLGGRIAEATVGADIPEQLEALCATCRIRRWDGFDKSKSHVSDGSSFTLAVTLADGSTLSARGSNAFPDNYSDFYSEILTLYTQLMEQYGTKGADMYE